MQEKQLLAVFASHPIQYQAPLFRALTSYLDIHVFFAHRKTAMEQAGDGFGIPFNWDADLLGGYEHTFLNNRAKRPSTERFFGCDTPEIYQLLRTGSFHAVLTMGWYLKSYIQATMASKRLRIPVMVRGDSTLLSPRSYLRGTIKRVLYPTLLAQLDAYLVVGHHAKDYLLYYGAKESRMFWCRHIVDNNWFRSRADACMTGAEVNRRDLGGLPEESMILFVGKFDPNKEPLDLVRALSILRNEGLPVRGVFVGDGRLYGDIERTAEELHVPVTLTGFKNQSEMPAIYAAADLLVLPSSSETWGLVVNEAMACSTPAIVSDMVGCAPDLIEEGQTGYQYPVGDIRALADAIRKLIPIAQSDSVRLAIERKMTAYSAENAANGIFEATRYLCSKEVDPK